MGILSDLFSPTNNAIFVRTDKPQYFTGERVTGTIALSVTQPLHIDGIYLKVKGFQAVKFNKPYYRTVYDPSAPGGQRQVQEWRVCQQKDVFFRRIFCIYSVRSTLIPANFVFPFDFVLDHNLPGSFQYKNEAQVVYKVKAEVVVPGLFTSNLKHKQLLSVNEPLRQAISRSDSFKEQNVTFCCCISKGHVNMAASIDKNAYAPGEQCNLTLMVDSRECQVDIDHISFSLNQSVTLKAHGDSHHEGSLVIKNRTPRVPAGSSTKRTIPLQIPANCVPSCRSSLITSEYTLRVKLAVPWCSDVELTVPVTVYAAPPPDYIQHVQFPANWSYQAMPMVHLNMSAGQQY